MRIEHQLEIKAPVARVWALTVDAEAWPKFTPTITRVEWLTPPPIGVGSKARIKQPAQRAKVWTVTKFETETRFVWTTKSVGLVMTGSHEMEPTTNGTKNTVRIELSGPLGWIMGAIFRGTIRKALKTENEGFRDTAEGG